IFVGAGADAPVVDDEHAVDARLLEGGLEHGRGAVEVNEQVVRLLRGATTGAQRDDTAARRHAALGCVELGIEIPRLLERDTEGAVELGAGRLHQTGAQLLNGSLAAELTDDEEVTEGDGCKYAHPVLWLYGTAFQSVNPNRRR